MTFLRVTSFGDFNARVGVFDSTNGLWHGR